MKTKIIALILIIATLLIFTGCVFVATPRPKENVIQIGDNCRFEYLGVKEEPYTKDYFHYWRDTTTDVVYICYKWSTGNCTYGGFTPLLNADGTPILWSEIKGEKETTK